MTLPWYLRNEGRAIRRNGGTPRRKTGSDGQLRGRPCEVKSARTDKRFRIGKTSHKSMVRRNGTYIFSHRGKTRRVSARKVSKMLGNGKWYRDRKYPHKFLKVEDIFR